MGHQDNHFCGGTVMGTLSTTLPFCTPVAESETKPKQKKSFSDATKAEPAKTEVNQESPHMEKVATLSDSVAIAAAANAALRKATGANAETPSTALVPDAASTAAHVQTLAASEIEPMILAALCEVEAPRALKFRKAVIDIGSTLTANALSRLIASQQSYCE